MPSGGNEKCFPWKLNRSSPQAARITSIDSSKISRLRASASRLMALSPLATTAPSDCASRGTVPRPTPNTMRPPLSTSAMAKSSARRSGCHWGTTLNICPNRSRSVSPARWRPNSTRLGVSS